MSFIHAPYRICPLGAHVDHQHGLVTGFALDRGVTLTYSPTNDGSIAITSGNFICTVNTTVHSATSRELHWGDYARSAVTVPLNDKRELSVGFRGEIKGTLPIGGLFSFASVIITYLRALATVNGISLTPQKLIELAH